MSTNDAKTKHTPGPWIVTDTLGFTKYRTRRFIREAANGDHGTVIAEIFPHRPGQADRAAVSQEEREANARLIAAAPELLQAAKQFIHVFDSGGYGRFAGDPQEVKTTRAAIAKAEGRA